MPETDAENLTFRRYGPTAVLVEFARTVDARAFARSRALVAALQRHPPAGLVEFVPGFTTLLCDFGPTAGRHLSVVHRELEVLLRRAAGEAADSEPGRLVEIPVKYDGPDLAMVASRANLPVREVVEHHVGTDYAVHCLGFAPGFPYLGGLDPRLHMPRLPVPRPRVEPGSVAIGGEHTGVYSVATPGGWNLIGRTSAPMFDPGADEAGAMFLVRAGDRVRFRAVPELDAPPAPLRAHDAGLPGARPCLRVVSPGVRITMQDWGRGGWRRFGVPPGGAMDAVSAAQANLLVGNSPEAAVLELCLQGQVLEVLEDAWFAAAGPDTGGTLASGEAVRLRAGTRLAFPRTFSGTWAYLAVEGGFAARRILGSVSTHVGAGLGRDLRVGDVVPRHAAIGERAWDQVARRSLAPPARRDFAATDAIRVWPGPQWELFDERACETLFRSSWKVSARSDRSGYRLEGPEILVPAGSMISEPVLVGSIQVPPGGQPIVTMPDGPTLGGYHKIGLVAPEDLPRLAQRLPGSAVRFQPAGK